MRYFGKCIYNGTSFFGWQKQKSTDNTVQERIEKAMSIILRQPVVITGCGRTDTGVHASEYYFHFDAEVDDLAQLKYKVNALLPDTIYLDAYYAVDATAHARYDAHRRGYDYYISYLPDPFREETVWHYPTYHKLDISLLHDAAALIAAYDEFVPFCKTGSNDTTKKCTIYESRWIETEKGLQYHVEANRFLRGMIRLIVGMSLNVSRGMLDIDDVKKALENQERLTTDWSVPGKGLFLSKVEYPYPLG